MHLTALPCDLFILLLPRQLVFGHNFIYRSSSICCGLERRSIFADLVNDASAFGKVRRALSGHGALMAFALSPEFGDVTLMYYIIIIVRY
jgi:hypothetical protein